jgi:hypothetical protein
VGGASDSAAARWAERMGIARPLAVLLALLVAVAAAAAEEPVAVADEAAAEVERLRAKISTLGQSPSLDLGSVLIFPLFGGDVDTDVQSALWSWVNLSCTPACFTGWDFPMSASREGSAY